MNMIKNPVCYTIVGTKDNRNIVFDYYRDIFSIDRAARFLESQGYVTKAWRCAEVRERLW